MDDPKRHESDDEAGVAADDAARTDTGSAAAPPGRRRALGMLACTTALACGAVVGVPAARFLWKASQGEGGGERWIRVARLADLENDTPTRAVVIADLRDAFTIYRDQVLGTVWLTRNGDEVTALSAICPHLGCAIDLAGDGAGFACPCHSAKFDLGGAPRSGPSPRPMDSLASRIVDGEVEVDFRKFRLGVPAKQEV